MAAIIGSPFVLAGAQELSDGMTTVISAPALGQVPDKPAKLSAVPLSQLKVQCDTPAGGDLAAPLNSFLVDLFTRAGRPRITESTESEFSIKTIIVSPPEMHIIKSGGGGFFTKNNPIFRKVAGSWEDIANIADVRLNNTNIVVAVRCKLDMRLLGRAQEVLVNRSVEVIRTNSLQALSVELSGFSVTGESASSSADTFVRGLTTGAVRQALINLAAYHAATNLLVRADEYFLISGSNERKDSEKPSSPSESDWLTVEEAAALLRVSVTDLEKELESGKIKARRIGSVWRISKKEL